MKNAIRFRFDREEGLKYIGHLDIMRLFERALKRAEMPVAHTQGFNPRMKLVFGLPMALGLTSNCEYADIELDAEMTPETFMTKLNPHLPLGIKVMDAGNIEKCGNIMNIIAAARYDVTIVPDKSIDRDEMTGMVQQILNLETLPVMKKSKKGMREVDIRPLIYSLTAGKVSDEAWVLGAFLNAGATDNLRPELVLDAFSQVTGATFRITSIHRKALYVSHENAWLTPLDEQVLNQSQQPMEE